MKIYKPLIALTVASTAVLGADASLVAHYNMDVRSGQIVESVSGERFGVLGNFAPENMPGAVGKALRFDGYTSWVNARIGQVVPAGSKKMTVSVWAAIESYPIIQIDTDTDEKTAIVQCIDNAAKTGFGFYVGFDGKWSFRAYVSGWPVEIKVDTPLPTWTWNNLVAVVDCDARSLKLYNNGVEVGSTRANGTLSLGPAPLTIGRGTLLNYSGPFLLTSFNGLIDDISVWDEAKTQSEIASWRAENAPDLIVPASRFDGQVLRPKFHGMPAANWTNECHGMTYSDGKFHLFFQKNGDGPYMARLHWGHLTSENLYDWQEERIAIAPGAPYDIKGCWSGCVFTDPQITGSLPAILYTGVDYGRASIDYAAPVSASLLEWSKSSANPIIPGRPAGLSDDFRDPYFFRHGDNAYIIVGSSKNGVGTTTLHRYNASNGTWSNDGDIFFSGASASQAGTFWEMPTVTQMPDGRWLFTATPLGTSVGVRTLYWTGTVSENGHFTPAANFTAPRAVELNSRDGFGLLSPTIYTHEGKTIVIGIVPDKLPSEENWKLGWAHCYSLPREWSLDDQGVLVQKPYEGLKGLRTSSRMSRSNFDLSGTLDLAPVSGRQAEILARFELGSSPFGFRLFKNANGAATATYTPATGQLVFDFNGINHISNDNGVYNGVYSLSLPEFLRAGQELKLNIFIDHSIIDVFINDRWATSIRVFPTDADADGIEAFANGTVKVLELNAWTLDPKTGQGGVGDITADQAPTDVPTDIYTPAGVLVRANTTVAEAQTELPAGIYIANGLKFVVK